MFKVLDARTAENNEGVRVSFKDRFFVVLEDRGRKVHLTSEPVQQPDGSWIDYVFLARVKLWEEADGTHTAVTEEDRRQLRRDLAGAYEAFRAAVSFE